MSETLEQLKKMEQLGFKLFGDVFKDTFTWVLLQRKKVELQSLESTAKRDE